MPSRSPVQGRVVTSNNRTKLPLEFSSSIERVGLKVRYVKVLATRRCGWSRRRAPMGPGPGQAVMSKPKRNARRTLEVKIMFEPSRLAGEHLADQCCMSTSLLLIYYSIQVRISNPAIFQAPLSPASPYTGSYPQLLWITCQRLHVKVDKHKNIDYVLSRYIQHHG